LQALFNAPPVASKTIAVRKILRGIFIAASLLTPRRFHRRVDYRSQNEPAMNKSATY
jgi:hypothetical protein